MNEQLENILLTTLEKAQQVGGEVYSATKDGIIKAVDFAKEQIPDVVRELMVWEFSYHLIWAIVGVLACVIALGAICFLITKITKDVRQNRDPFGWVLGLVLGGCFILGPLTVWGFGHAIGDSLVCVKIKTAPKLFLVDYCADLLKNKATPTKREHHH